MALVDSGDVAERARQRALVRRGYDAISLAYRSDDGDPAASSAADISRYAGWAAELAGLLRPGARVVDLGCGAGIPATLSWPATGCRSSALISPPSSFTAPGTLSPQPASCKPTWPACT
jgi:hypothetical protein